MVAYLILFVLFVSLEANSSLYTGNPYLINDLDYKRNLQVSNSTFQPVRISIDNTTIINQVNNGLVSSSYVYNVLACVERAVRDLRFLLKVIPLNSFLTFDYCHPQVTIDSKIIGVGYPADLIIFPFININSTSKSEFYAQYCKQGVDGRPVAGYIAISNNFDFSQLNANEYYTTSILHGLFHIAGFDEDLFSSYVVKGTTTNRNYNEIAITDISDTGNQLLFIESKVVNTAQNYFNCTSVRGIPLKSKKYDGAIATHWKSRYMLGDLMIDLIYVDRVISEITLALFESTGWYEVNYFTGGLFRYGKNEGCTFITNKCVNNGYTSFSNEFCTTPGLFMCSSGHLSRGYCYLDNQLSTPLPVIYQFFNNEFIGGLKDVDYCPVSVGDLKRNGMFYPDNCSIGDNPYYNSFGETTSSKAGCFLTNLFLINDPGIQTFSKQMTAVCYEYFCNTNTLTYIIKIKENQYTCPTEGGLITTAVTSGSLQCPRYSMICTKTVDCTVAINCIELGSLNSIILDTLQVATQQISGTQVDLKASQLESNMNFYDSTNLFTVGLRNVQSANRIRISFFLLIFITLINLFI